MSTHDDGVDEATWILGELAPGGAAKKAEVARRLVEDVLRAASAAGLSVSGQRVGLSQAQPRPTVEINGDAEGIGLVVVGENRSERVDLTFSNRQGRFAGKGSRDADRPAAAIVAERLAALLKR